MRSAASGASLLLAALLGSAGAIKLLRPEAIAQALGKLVPSRSLRGRARAYGRLIGAVELATALALLAADGDLATVVAAGTVALGLGFTVAVELAIRKGASCGCWGSLSNGPAGGAEATRAAGVAALGALVLVARATWHDRPSVTVASLAAGGALAVAWIVLAAAVARLRPTPSTKTEPAGLLAAFVLGPGGIDRRPHRPNTVVGLARSRALRRMARDPSVRLALERAAPDGIHWDRAVVLRPVEDDGTPTRSLVASASGPAGWIRVVEAPDGRFVVLGVVGGVRILGAEGKLADAPGPS